MLAQSVEEFARDKSVRLAGPTIVVPVRVILADANLVRESLGEGLVTVERVGCKDRRQFRLRHGGEVFGHDCFRFDRGSNARVGPGVGGGGRTLHLTEYDTKMRKNDADGAKLLIEDQRLAVFDAIEATARPCIGPSSAASARRRKPPGARRPSESRPFARGRRHGRRSSTSAPTPGCVTG